MDISEPETIGKSAILIFQNIFSPSKEGLKLEKIRRIKYEEIISSNRKSIDPAELPPSPRAAYFHGLRVHHQGRVWRNLSIEDKSPTI